MARLTLCVLGPLQIACDGTPVTGLESAKVRALLVYLAVEAARPHPRAALAGLLWPELAEGVAQHNLRQALTNLRQALGDRAADPPFLLISRETVQFNPAGNHWLDVAAFTSLLATCDAHPHRRAITCASCAERRAGAAALYRGDFLAEEAYAEWVFAERDRLRDLAGQALRGLAAAKTQAGDLEGATDQLDRLAELEPLDVAIHRELIQALLAQGLRSNAKHCFDSFAHRTRRELGEEPGFDLRLLAAQARAADR